MDMFTAWPPITGGCQLECAAPPFELEQILHGSFSPTTFSDDDGPLVILQARRHDFARTGRVSIDENYHRHSGGDNCGWSRIVTRSFLAISPARADDASTIQE